MIAPDGTLFAETDIAANPNMLFPDGAVLPTEKVVWISDPAPGVWTLRIPDAEGLGDVTFAAAGGSTIPTIEMIDPGQDVTPGGNGYVNISYSAFDPDSDAEIALYYDVGEGFDGAEIVSGLLESDGQGTFAWDTSSVPAGDYFVYAVIQDETGLPQLSNYSVGRVTIADAEAPDRVDNLRAEWSGSDQVRLNWDPVAGAEFYVIHYSPDAAGEILELRLDVDGTETEAVLQGLVPGETYRFQVRALTIQELPDDTTDFQSGLPSVPAVGVVGPMPTVAPATGQWEVFADPDLLYTETVDVQRGEGLTLEKAPAGATLDTDTGAFQWQVPSDADGWFEVVINVTHDDGTSQQIRRHLLADADRVGAIAGMKFDDLDGDGEHEPGELGINNWTIELLDVITGEVLLTRTTESIDVDGNGEIDATYEQGRYRFDALTPGDYVVREVPQEGWTQTFPIAPGTYAVSLSPGLAVGDLDFGNVEVAVSQPPVAKDDTASTDEDQSVVIAVLANNSGTDGTLVPATVTITVDPSGGAVAVEPSTGSVTYTPYEDCFGGDSFAYRVEDDLGSISNVAAVAVTVAPVNDAPVAGNDTTATGDDSSVIVAVLANDEDVEDDALTVASVTDPAVGTAVINADGTVTYDPGQDFQGIVSFDYTIEDGKGGSDTATATVTVTHVNRTPIANAGGPYVVYAGHDLTIDGRASSDPDEGYGDSVVLYEWDLDDDGVFEDATTPSVVMPWADLQELFQPDVAHPVVLRVTDGFGLSSVDATTLTIVSNRPPTADPGGPYTVAEGTNLTLDGTGSADDEGIVNFEWDLDYDEINFDVDITGSQSTVTFDDDFAARAIALRVTDTDGASSVQTTTLDVTNVAPVVNAFVDKTVYEGEMVNFIGSYQDAGSADTHRFTWEFGDGVSASGPMTLMNISSHRYAVPGTYTATLTVTDDDGGANSDTLIVTVLNAPPEVDAGPDQTVDEGSEVVFSGSATDQSPDYVLTYGWDFGDGSDAVSGADLTSLSHTYADDGEYTVTLTVDDGGGGTTSDTLTVTVDNVAPSPTILGVPVDNQSLQHAAITLDRTTGDPAGEADAPYAYLWQVTTNVGQVIPDGRRSTFSFTPEQPGTYSVSLTVTDKDGGNESIPPR